MNLTQLEYETACVLCQMIYDKKCDEKLLPEHRIETLRGLKARIFEINGTEYIVYSGTNGAFAINDWLNNLKIGLGIVPSQFHSALEFASKHLEHDKRTIVCGHSLGGGLCVHSCSHISHDNVACVSFNAAGIRHILNPKKNKIDENNIYNFITSRDILFRLTSILPFNWMKYVGETTIIADDESWNGIKSHSNWQVFRNYKL